MYDKVNKHLTDDTGCLICDLETGEKYLSHNETKRFRSASVIKLFVLLCALEKNCVNDIIPCRSDLGGSETAELGLEKSSVDDLLYMMIASSDNGATNVLIDYLSFDAINGSIKNLTGTKTTSLQRKMLDYKAIEDGLDNYTSPLDAFLATREIFRLGGEKYLKSAKCLDRLMRYIYKDCVFYGKAGDMQGAVHDTGVLEKDGKRIFAAFMSENYTSAIEACGFTGLAALDVITSEENGK